MVLKIRAAIPGICTEVLKNETAVEVFTTAVLKSGGGAVNFAVVVPKFTKRFAKMLHAVRISVSPTRKRL